MLSSSFRALRTHQHLCHTQKMVVRSCGGAYHFLYQKPTAGHNKTLSTETMKGTSGQQVKGSSRHSWKERGYSWRELVEYGLKGLAISLLFYTVCDELVSPWFKAHQRKKQLSSSENVSSTSKAAIVSTKNTFSSAKCTTTNGGDVPRRSQQYNFLAEAVERAAPSVVFIEKAQPVHTIFGRQMSVSTGSGFIVSEDGYVLTNAHVVGSTSSVKVKLASGKIVKGEVTDLDQVADLALLKLNVSEKLPALEFGSSSKVRPGEWVVALGSPLSLSNTITAGIVSSCHRPSKELGLHHNGPDMQYVQTDAPITMGNSGGPLVNLDGEVIGVNTLTAGPGISFAIPSDFAKDFISKANKTAKRPGKFAIGISMLTITPDLRHVLEQRGIVPSDLDSGVLVAQVWPYSVAAQAGLKKGDVIVRINGQTVSSSRQVCNLVHSGKRLNMEIIRNSTRITISLTPEKM